MSNVSDCYRRVHAEGVGVLEVSATGVLTVAAAPGVDPSEVRGLVEGSGAALQLQAQRIFPLHGATVSQGRQALALVGPRVSGKSSLAAALSAHGWQMVADDLTAVEFDSAEIPAVRAREHVLRLWGQTVRELGWSVEESSRVQPGMDKYRLERPKLFTSDPARLRTVYALTTDENMDFIPVSGAQRFQMFYSHATYNGEFLDTPALRKWQFTKAIALARAVRMFAVTTTGSSVTALAARIDRHAKGLD